MPNYEKESESLVDGYRVVRLPPAGDSPRGQLEAFRPDEGPSIGRAASDAGIRSLIAEDKIKVDAVAGRLQTVEIDLHNAYPIEPGYVQSSYDFHREKYRNGEPVENPTAANFGEDYLITEGCNRSAAASAEGRTTLRVIVVPSGDKEAEHRAILDLRRRQQRDCTNMKAFPDKAARKKEFDMEYVNIILPSLSRPTATESRKSAARAIL